MAVDKTLAYGSRYSPTVEHKTKVVSIMAMARTWAEAVAMTCDTSQWDIAHQRCNARQGQRVSTQVKRLKIDAAASSSRRW